MDQVNQPINLLNVLTELTGAHFSLGEVLQDEKNILTQLDVDALNELSKKKQSLLEKITQMEHTFTQAFSFAATSDFRQAVEHVIAELPSAERLATQQAWKELVDQVNKCKNLNKINAAIVQASLSHTRKKLDILISGVSLHDDTYDETGIMK